MIAPVASSSTNRVSTDDPAPQEEATTGVDTSATTDKLWHKEYRPQTYIRGNRRSGRDDYWVYTSDVKHAIRVHVSPRRIKFIPSTITTVERREEKEETKGYDDHRQSTGVCSFMRWLSAQSTHVAPLCMRRWMPDRARSGARSSGGCICVSGRGNSRGAHPHRKSVRGAVITSYAVDIVCCETMHRPHFCQRERSAEVEFPLQAPQCADCPALRFPLHACSPDPILSDVGSQRRVSVC